MQPYSVRLTGAPHKMILSADVQLCLVEVIRSAMQGTSDKAMRKCVANIVARNLRRRGVGQVRQLNDIERYQATESIGPDIPEEQLNEWRKASKVGAITVVRGELSVQLYCTPAQRTEVEKAMKEQGLATLRP